MSTRLYFNIDAKRVKDRNYLIALTRDVKPAVAGVMDDLQLATDLKNASPTTVVWHRAFGDTEAVTRQDPVQLANRYAGEGYGSRGVVAYGPNEPAQGNNLSWGQIVNWTVRHLEACAAKGVRSCAPNWGPGNIEPSDIAAGTFDPLLEAQSNYADWHYGGEHDYTGMLLPWGGGWGGRSREDFQFPDRLQPDRWTTVQEFQDLSASYHLGRGRRLDERAKVKGWRVINKLVTEFGHDRMPDWEDPRGFNPYPYLESKYGTSGYAVIRGPRSLRDVWKAWFPFWTFEEALWQQLVWADKVYPPHYLGFNLYQWCTDAPDWDKQYGYDYGVLTGIHERMKGSIMTNPTSPQPVPKPADAGAPVQATLKAGYNLRSGPGTNYPVVRVLTTGSVVTYYPNEAQKTQANGFEWVYVEQDGELGFVAHQGQFVPFEDETLSKFPDWWPKDTLAHLPVEFMSQRNTGTNNCFEAAYVPFHNYWAVKTGQPTTTLQAVINLVNNAGKYATFADAQRVINHFKLPATIQKDVTLEEVVGELNVGRPMIALVERGKIPGALAYHPFAGSHFVDVVGYDAAGLTIHDPLGTAGGPGDSLLITPNDFLAAWETTPGNTFRRQAILFDADAFDNGEEEPAEEPAEEPDEKPDEELETVTALNQLKEQVAELTIQLQTVTAERNTFEEEAAEARTALQDLKVKLLELAR